MFIIQNLLEGPQILPVDIQNFGKIQKRAIKDIC